MDTSMQVLKIGLEILLVVPPRHPVRARRGMFFQGKELRFEQVGVDVVEQRGEPLLLPFPCSSPYALQRLGHACPARRPGRALLARIPLGPGPWLHQLRSRSLRLVRRLLSYYDRVRFPASVHHRLRLLAFPMRTIDLIGRWSDAGPPRFRRDPFARDVVFDPGRTTRPCIAALLMLRSTMETVSAPAICPFRGSIHTPRNSCVRFVAGVAAGLTQHSLPGGSLRLTWAGLPPADRASFLAHLHPGYGRGTTPTHL